ncbi:DUF323 domain-containing protein [Fomitiporia mediterranea MF3/22]|uniref:DUF323 domain-containing protein n=1 Tax=Fomitiporia mediterranea (strain MF3/22) TaxID=694068 RepID=UPI000440788C|nr:DUF323 domain-containing protein [Fomitiporia mediterranea MF3/22]EJD05995.1 DUF323 domain-containing protein [Fomitiporia mediterranea MF3/22]
MLSAREPSPEIIDVRIADGVQTPDNDSGSADLREQIIQGLNKPEGAKTLPTMLLYDELGLRLYDAITTDCPEYYLFAAEEEILKENSDEIVRLMHARDGEADVHVKPVVLELGAGALRKTSHILLALSRLAASSTNSPIDNEKDHIIYFALDLEKRELERTLSELMENYGDQLSGKVAAKGMWGTYDGGLKFVEEGGLAAKIEIVDSSEEGCHDYIDNANRHSPSAYHDSKRKSSGDESPHSSSTPLHILFLGSSIGNFDRESATSFLRGLPLRPGSGDTLLLGLDHDNVKDQIELAYNDPKNITKDFIMNGLKNAGRMLGKEDLFKDSNWEYFNRYNEAERRHEAYYKSTTNQKLEIPGSNEVISFLANELVNVEVSVKFSDKDAYTMFTKAELRPMMRWTDSAGKYSLWLLERPAFTFPLLESPHPFGVPTLDDFRTIWKAWDTITIGMIPRSMLFTKPIDLRHICLFYLGHIPAFLDIHLSRLLGEPHTEPENFKDIFERGIDPHVDDPSQCHPHSEVPQNEEDWPSLESILNFRDRVRARLSRLYDDLGTGKRQLTRKIGRVLFMTLEHEGLHAETLLYMLLQGAGKPGGTLPPPGFTVPHWDALAEQWSSTPSPAEPTVTLGSAEITLGHDDPEELDEHPAFRANLDNVEFGWDNEHPKREVHVDEFRIEWRPVSNGEFYEFYEHGGKDLVMLPASWVEIDGEVQVRTLFGPLPMRVAQSWPLLASYDDLSKYAQVKGGRLPTEAELRLFFDKFKSGYEGGANCGFRNWHPVPATTGGVRNGGKGHNGGVWEWTSTVFDKYDGYAQSRLYPGYSADFFDGKHRVVLGGSYATIPRLSDRRSVRNWYQHNYPYPWVAGRIAYDK